MIQAITKHGITRRAVEQNRVVIHTLDPRDFTTDRHRTVDDRPYGGGPGMVMLYEPLKKTIQQARSQSPESHLIYLSPQGRPLTQRRVQELAEKKHLILLAGRYEGIDERIIQSEVDEEISIGDYVVSGGELPAMVLMDAIIRLLPGVLGHTESAQQDSFSNANVGTEAGTENSMLDCPHYTRPEEIDGMKVPEILLSGNHQAIADWRKEQAQLKTRIQRPDLL